MDSNGAILFEITGDCIVLLWRATLCNFYTLTHLPSLCTITTPYMNLSFIFLFTELHYAVQQELYQRLNPVPMRGIRCHSENVHRQIEWQKHLDTPVE